jgi:hypothetical protein
MSHKFILVSSLISRVSFPQFRIPILPHFRAKIKMQKPQQGKYCFPAHAPAPCRFTFHGAIGFEAFIFAKGSNK